MDEYEPWKSKVRVRQIGFKDIFAPADHCERLHPIRNLTFVSATGTVMHILEALGVEDDPFKDSDGFSFEEVPEPDPWAFLHSGSSPQKLALAVQFLSWLFCLIVRLILGLFDYLSLPLP